MTDQFVVTESTGWVSRLVGSIKGVLVGLVFFAGAFPLLFWNEGRAVRRAQDLEEGRGAVVEVSADVVRPADEGRLVHLSGAAATNESLTDVELGPTAAGSLRLRRTVEMYQWKEESKSETKKKLGGGEETTTTYTYSKAWSSSLIDSSKFQKPDGHTNPESLPVESETFTAEGIHVGKFELPESLTGLISNFVSRPVTKAEAQAAAKAHSTDIEATTGGLLYVGANPQQPALGDLRITFQMAPSGPVSTSTSPARNERASSRPSSCMSSGVAMSRVCPCE